MVEGSQESLTHTALKYVDIKTQARFPGDKSPKLDNGDICFQTGAIYKDLQPKYQWVKTQESLKGATYQWNLKIGCMWSAGKSQGRLQ